MFVKAPPIRGGIKSLRKEASRVGERKQLRAYSSSRGPISGGLQPSVSSVLEGITALALHAHIHMHMHIYM